MNTFIALLGGLGLGTLITTVINRFLEERYHFTDKLYENKKNAYLGLLHALHLAAIEPSDKHSKEYALWQSKCDLFGSNEVRRYVQEMVDTNDDKGMRTIAFNNLLGAMRQDLQRR